MEMAKEYVKMGFYIGVGGVVTFNNAKKLKEVVAYMPLDRIVLETDCPYLSPVPKSRKAQFLAESSVCGSDDRGAERNQRRRSDRCDRGECKAAFVPEVRKYKI